MGRQLKDKPIRLAALVARTRALGPGDRAAVWFQGCPFSCPGCIAPQFLPMGGGRAVLPAVLARKIRRIGELEGVTISGGEPFAQPDALAVLVRTLRDSTDLGVIVFSGFTLAELLIRAEKVPGILSALQAIDLLIDGRYRHEQNDSRGLRGSSNQKFHHLTPRYQDLDDNLRTRSRTLEEQKTALGEFYVGIPTFSEWHSIVYGVSDD